MEIFSLSFYQIILILLSIFLLLRNVSNFRRNTENRSLVKFIIVTIFWIFVILIISFPKLTHLISKELGMGENFNTLIFTAFIINFIIILKILSSIENLEHDITEIIREKALLDLEKNLRKRSHETKTRNRDKN